MKKYLYRSFVLDNRVRYYLLCLILLLVSSCAPLEPVPKTDDTNPTPADFPAIVYPADNPYSSAKASLGRYLFYDRRLSLDNSTSCGDCHKQSSAFSDGGVQFSKGFHNLPGVHNAMTLSNVAYNLSSGWDGGVPSLEKQILVPLLSSFELNMNTDTLLERLKKDNDYRAKFSSAWGDENITLERITKSIATFERRMISSHSRYDRFNAGDASALTSAEQHGKNLFFGEKGDCFHCHGSYNFTDNGFHNNGLDSMPTDPGRNAVTTKASDYALFRAPTLRNIAITPPYMHDGRFGTLEQVIQHYNSGGKHSTTIDPTMRPLDLTDQEMKDMVLFLKTLTDSTFISDTTLSNPWK